MKNQWYIMLYHNVSWEENAYVRGIGGTCPPDIFREHLSYLHKVGEFVSIQDGIELELKGKVKSPMFSFWFDDGMSGVLKYAMPILNSYNTKGALSICSRFVDREEMFWRFKLSYLSHIDGLRFLRSRLRKYGYKLGMSVKDFCFTNFSLDIIREIDAVMQILVPEDESVAAFRLFVTNEDILALKSAGWVIGNHTAAHYPVGEDCFAGSFAEHFRECDGKFSELFGEPSKFWVVPFGVVGSSAQQVVRYLDFGSATKYLVHADDVWHDQQAKDGKLFRLNTPICRGG